MPIQKFKITIRGSFTFRVVSHGGHYIHEVHVMK